MKRAFNFKDLTGKKFGRLTVLGLSHIANRNSHWKCLCDCGKITTVYRGNLKKKHGTKSCGCYNLECKRVEKGLSGFNKLYKQYEFSAKKRNLIFSLTKNQLKKLTSQNCHYCSRKPESESIAQCERTTEEGKEYSKYLYNGIDRINNNIGYIYKNCVPCCKICNRGKRELTYEEFMCYINRIKNLGVINGRC